MTIQDYIEAGYNGRQTDAMWSSTFWLAEQAGKKCKELGITPLECKQSRGYSILVNRKYLIKFNTNTLEFESITTK